MTTTTSSLTANDIMSAEPVCVEPSTTLRQLARVFEENEISGAPVIDEQGRVTGVVSMTDIIRRCTEGEAASIFEMLRDESDDDETLVPQPEVRVEELMTEAPVTVAPETPVGEVARLMVDGRFHRVVVVDRSHFPIGIITSLDVLGGYAARAAAPADSPAARRRGEVLLGGDQE